jgi:hypothetical protein
MKHFTIQELGFISAGENLQVIHEQKLKINLPILRIGRKAWRQFGPSFCP